MDKEENKEENGNQGNWQKAINVGKVIIRNKYILATATFLIWMTFLDENSFLQSFKYSNEITKLKMEIAYYKKDLERCKEQSYQLKSDRENLEKFAREQYFMKKSNEDIYKIK